MFPHSDQKWYTNTGFEPLNVKIEGWYPKEAEQEYLDLFHWLVEMPGPGVP